MGACGCCYATRCVEAGARDTVFVGGTWRAGAQDIMVRSNRMG